MPSYRKLIQKQWVRILVVVAIGLLAQPLYAAYTFAITPSVIRSPKLEHYHFRMQILVQGKAEDFSTDAYQTEYAKDQCTADLPAQPIHFHDHKNQIVHIHWEGITGGMVLKYYGWNYIGGVSDALGYRLEGFTHRTKVPIHGTTLPAVPAGAHFYVYTGDETGYQERNFNDWTGKDLEDFFGRTSNFPAHKTNKGIHTSLLNQLFPKASAHGVVADEQGVDANETQSEKLTRINNLLGNVVIFVQNDKPTDAQIKDRFNHLEPLSESTCGG